jgi:hypothetical protein
MTNGITCADVAKLYDPDRVLREWIDSELQIISRFVSDYARKSYWVDNSSKDDLESLAIELEMRGFKTLLSNPDDNSFYYRLEVWGWAD